MRVLDRMPPSSPPCRRSVQWRRAGIREALAAVDIIFEEIARGMERGDRVWLREFGVFFARQWRGYIQSGTLNGMKLPPVAVPARAGVRFRPSTVLAARLNPGP
ncbi:MAG: HU family DNA-binding protein [Pseudomonadota bacterium]|nr:HU family DNA-binding protein [Pseudomonadota bacterium]